MTAVIEKLSPDFTIPYDVDALESGNPERVAIYLLELAQTLQDMLRDIIDRTNFVIALADGDAVYYALPGSDGTYPVGTWRTKQVGDNLEDQVQLALGTWTFVHKRERPV